MIPFFPFLCALREEGVPVAFNEWLDFLRALSSGAIHPRLSSLYAVGRSLLVKSEIYYDRYDRAFLRTFSRLADREALELFLEETIPTIAPELRDFFFRLFEDLLKHQESIQTLSSEKESKGQPGISYSDSASGFHLAYKIAGERRFKAYDSDRILDTSGLRRALARWRKTELKGQIPSLDLARTIETSARSGGEIEIRFSFPPRRRRILLLTDVGGTMNVHIEIVEKFLTALFREIRRIDHFYFHNTLYENLYRDANRKEPVPAREILRLFSSTHSLVIVGDASMGSHELLYPHSAIEGDNEIPSIAILTAFSTGFPGAVWLNPEPQTRWKLTPSISIIARFFPMYPLTIAGIVDALKSLLEKDPLVA